MCGIQNVTRKQGTYYYRKLIRLGADKPFRLRLSLKTTSRRRAALLAPALTLICERVAMGIVSNMARDGLTAAQRAEIFRRQMLVERDRLEAMHASLHVLPPDDHDDIGKALTLRLGASEMAAQDGAMQGKVEDFLVARVDPDNDDEDIVILAWSDLAASIEHEGADFLHSLSKAEMRKLLAHFYVKTCGIEFILGIVRRGALENDSKVPSFSAMQRAQMESPG
ncbi:hypothetical protein [Qipengyuania sp.]|uniref:hypothetical protein n=1 Tax=Qipengyuania sp. TaxID=2004515 RepID=UPI0035C83E63